MLPESVPPSKLIHPTHTPEAEMAFQLSHPSPQKYTQRLHLTSGISTSVHYDKRTNHLFLVLGKRREGGGGGGGGGGVEGGGGGGGGGEEGRGRRRVGRFRTGQQINVEKRKYTVQVFIPVARPLGSVMRATTFGRSQV